MRLHHDRSAEPPLHHYTIGISASGSRAESSFSYRLVPDSDSANWGHTTVSGGSGGHTTISAGSAAPYYILIGNENVIDSFRRSIHLVRSNLKSVLGFSLVWLVLLNAFLIPEYLLQLTLTDAGPADVLPVTIGIPVSILLPIGIFLSAVGFAYFYTVYTAYYLRLIEVSPASLESA
ncbi:hypothetical protein [Halostagnicola sp. A56]|uniref:DUF7847 domain-containing protein n=1 Tax=Halostagnicola sp. A56 TaxID=1495067 RepID=UPI001E32529D|nr:hypothetical protein [Halostagnicola sp. A56]